MQYDWCVGWTPEKGAHLIDRLRIYEGRYRVRVYFDTFYGNPPMKYKL
ncbi:Uncharacterised protein [uncultured archaeon]|nr:Uncharacterised protein [uncultured archaeon]